MIIFELMLQLLLKLLALFGITASFPSLTPPKNIAFHVFVRDEDDGKEFLRRSSTLAGETDTIEFSGSVNEGSDELGSRFGFIESCGSTCPPLLSTDTSLHYINPGRPN
jgi:hypothetical protein